MRRRATRSKEELRHLVDRLSVERLLSETTILRVTLDFIEERGLGADCLKCIRRRSR